VRTLPHLHKTKKRFDFLDETMGLDLDLIIYLRTDPEIAYKRMMSRGRSEEAGAPLGYLQLLHDAYEDWLIHQVPLRLGDNRS
jgi:deoxyadenosine/deoxycytidine kinase